MIYLIIFSLYIGLFATFAAYHAIGWSRYRKDNTSNYIICLTELQGDIAVEIVEFHNADTIINKFCELSDIIHGQLWVLLMTLFPKSYTHPITVFLYFMFWWWCPFIHYYILKAGFRVMSWQCPRSFNNHINKCDHICGFEYGSAEDIASVNRGERPAVGDAKHEGPCIHATDKSLLNGGTVKAWPKVPGSIKGFIGGDGWKNFRDGREDEVKFSSNGRSGTIIRKGGKITVYWAEDGGPGGGIAYYSLNGKALPTGVSF